MKVCLLVIVIIDISDFILLIRSERFIECQLGSKGPVKPYIPNGSNLSLLSAP